MAVHALPPQLSEGAGQTIRHCTPDQSVEQVSFLRDGQELVPGTTADLLVGPYQGYSIRATSPATRFGNSLIRLAKLDNDLS